MARANNSETRVAYVAEATDNTTPANPAFNVFRATGEAMDVMRKLVFSRELNGKRGEKNHAVASANGSGTLNFEFSDGTLEDFMESALRGAWTADVLTDGKTPKTFTLEVMFEQGATDTYKRFTGSQVSTLALNLRAAETVTGTVGFMSRGADFSQAAIAGAAYTDGNSESIMVGAAFGALAMSGLTMDCLTAVSFNLNNNLAFEECLGSLAPTGIGPGGLEITGTLGMFLDSGEYDVLRAYADGTATSLTFELGTTAGKKTRFELPNIVLSDLKVNSETPDGKVVVSVNYRALQAASLSGAAVRVTRNV